jgi:hypothetical protein
VFLPIVNFLVLSIDDIVAAGRTSVAGRSVLRRTPRAGIGGATVDRLAEARESL